MLQKIISKGIPSASNSNHDMPVFKHSNKDQFSIDSIPENNWKRKKEIWFILFLDLILNSTNLF